MAMILLSMIAAGSAAVIRDDTVIGMMPNSTLKYSDGCTTLRNSADGGNAIKKVTYKWATRPPVIHTGLEFETDNGKYALAYNSRTVPGTVSTPGAVWCQSGGMPMKNALANGDCPDCGGWFSGETATGTFNTLGGFMKDVEAYGDSHPDYNLLACTLKGNTANCQAFASHMFKQIVGHHPDKGECPECPKECDV